MCDIDQLRFVPERVTPLSVDHLYGSRQDVLFLARLSQRGIIYADLVRRRPPRFFGRRLEAVLMRELNGNRMGVANIVRQLCVSGDDDFPSLPLETRVHAAILLAAVKSRSIAFDTAGLDPCGERKIVDVAREIARSGVLVIHVVYPRCID